MSSYAGTKLQQRKRARKFGFRNRLLNGQSVLKSKRLKGRTRMAVVIKSQKQRLPI
jgi:ribosomal protein L34